MSEGGDEDAADDGTDGYGEEGVPWFHADESSYDGGDEPSRSLKGDHDEEDNTDESEGFDPAVFLPGGFSFVFDFDDESADEGDFFCEVVVPDEEKGDDDVNVCDG